MTTEEFCEVYHIETSFISKLQEYGLIEITTMREQKLIAKDRIYELEKFIRLHYDLDINMPGIDAILHLLQRINDLQAEVWRLKTQLHRYE